MYKQKLFSFCSQNLVAFGPPSTDITAASVATASAATTTVDGSRDSGWQVFLFTFRVSSSLSFDRSTRGSVVRGSGTTAATGAGISGISGIVVVFVVIVVVVVVVAAATAGRRRVKR